MLGLDHSDLAGAECPGVEDGDGQPNLGVMWSTVPAFPAGRRLLRDDIEALGSFWGTSDPSSLWRWDDAVSFPGSPDDCELVPLGGTSGVPVSVSSAVDPTYTPQRLPGGRSRRCRSALAVRLARAASGGYRRCMRARLAWSSLWMLVACGPASPSDPDAGTTGSSNTNTDGSGTQPAVDSTSTEADGSTSEGSTCAPSPDLETRPTGELIEDGSAIRLLPSGIRFALPELFQGQLVTILLDESELAIAEHGAGEWQTEYASVANAVLPFERCAAHFGDDQWPQGVSYFTLWVRAYVLDATVPEVEAWMLDGAVAAIEAAGGTAPVLEQAVDGPWRQTRASFELGFGDYGGTANVDLRATELDGLTLAFVFMYSGPAWNTPDHSETMTEILGSVCATDLETGACCE